LKRNPPAPLTCRLAECRGAGHSQIGVDCNPWFFRAVKVAGGRGIPSSPVPNGPPPAAWPGGRRGSFWGFAWRRLGAWSAAVSTPNAASPQHLPPPPPPKQPSASQPSHLPNPLTPSTPNPPTPKPPNPNPQTSKPPKDFGLSKSLVPVDRHGKMTMAAHQVGAFDRGLTGVDRVLAVAGRPFQRTCTFNDMALSYHC
jgi:hypothetical protein